MYIKTFLLEDSPAEDAEAGEMVERMTQLILSSDTLRRLCNEKDVIKAGVVAAEDVKSLMSDVKVQLSEDQFTECIKALSGDENGKVHLEDFIKQYETIIITEYDKADALTAENENQDTGEQKEPPQNEEIDRKKKGGKVLDVRKDSDNDGCDNVGEKTEHDNIATAGSNVKGMVDKLEKMTL